MFSSIVIIYINFHDANGYEAEKKISLNIQDNREIAFQKTETDIPFSNKYEAKSQQVTL